MAHSNVVAAVDDAVRAPLEAIGVHLFGVGGGCLSISLLQYVLFSYSKPSPSLSSSLFNPTIPPCPYRPRPTHRWKSSRMK